MTNLCKGTTIHTAFGDYRLVQQIGQGGNGRVFSAVDFSGTSVAIKFVLATLTEEKRKRLKNEIHFCENTECPNIIKIIDHGYFEAEDGGFLFYVMPLYERTLRDKMKAGMTADEILDVFTGVLLGLRYAHSKGIIHRDVKPENILLKDASCNPVICDFGIAHFSEEELYTAVETRATERLANFNYAAPEQKQRASVVGPPTDLYSLCLILNEMFTGEIPQASGYRKISEVNEKFAFLDTLFVRLFRQNMRDRIQSANEVLMELEALSIENEHNIAAIKIQQQIDSSKEPQKIELSVTSVSYQDGVLCFAMSEPIPVGWLAEMANTNFSRQAIQGYDKNRVYQCDEQTLGMRLRGGEPQDIIIRIVLDVKTWVSTVNELFYKQQLYDYSAVKRKAEEKRNAELQTLAESRRVNTILANL